VSALVIAWPDGTTELAEGRVHGSLVWPPAGERGFGYDPMFQPDGHAQTFRRDVRRREARDRWDWRSRRRCRTAPRVPGVARKRLGLGPRLALEDQVRSTRVSTPARREGEESPRHQEVAAARIAKRQPTGSGRRSRGWSRQSPGGSCPS
jgi:hypothetical protein